MAKETKGKVFALKNDHQKLVESVDALIGIDTDVDKIDFTTELVKLGIPEAQQDVVGKKLYNLCVAKKEQKIKQKQCDDILAEVKASPNLEQVVAGVPYAKTADDLAVKLIPDGFQVGLKNGVDTNG